MWASGTSARARGRGDEPGPHHRRIFVKRSSCTSRTKRPRRTSSGRRGTSTQWDVPCQLGLEGEECLQRGRGDGRDPMSARARKVGLVGVGALVFGSLAVFGGTSASASATSPAREIVPPALRVPTTGDPFLFDGNFYGFAFLNWSGYVVCAALGSVDTPALCCVRHRLVPTSCSMDETSANWKPLLASLALLADLDQDGGERVVLALSDDGSCRDRAGRRSGRPVAGRVRVAALRPR